MIDTIRFLIPVSEEVYKRIIKKCTCYIRFDQNTKEKKVRYHLKDVKLGSYDRNINIFIQSSGFIEIEFSIPKYWIGHNIFMVYPKDLRLILNNLRKYFIKLFDNFTKIDDWIIRRIDFCYNWKLLDEKTAYDVLTLLKTYEIPKKHRFERDTCIMYYSDICSVKFYLKYPEFYKHDFLKLKAVDLDLAYNCLSLAQGVLRFEVEMKHQQILNHFGREVTYKEITKDVCETILKKHRDIFLRGHNPQVTSLELAYQQLKKVYSPRRARTLFLFYMAYNGQSKQVQQLLLADFDSSSLSRKFGDINRAGLGIPSEEVYGMYDIQIPSAYGTNCATPAAGKPRGSAATCPPGLPAFVG